MGEQKETESPRDDAQAQPESGYPDGRLPTKQSADPRPEESRVESNAGSEAEFDSPKNPNPN